MSKRKKFKKIVSILSIKPKISKTDIKALPLKKVVVYSKKTGKSYIRNQHYNPLKDIEKFKNKELLNAIKGNFKKKLGFKPTSKVLYLPYEIHKELVNKIEDVGLNPEKAYYIGDLVRDSLMYGLGYFSNPNKLKLDFNDINLVYEKPTNEEIKKLEKHFKKMSNDSLTFKTRIKTQHNSLPIDVEITLPNSKNNKIKKNTDLSNSTIYDDLKNQDITINAIAINMKDPNTIIDPFGGIQDLKNKVIRHVSDDTFIKDPIKVLKVARFSSKYPDFQVAPETIEIIKSHNLNKKILSVDPERLREEIFKTFKQSGNNVSKFFDVLDLTDTLKYLFPEIKKLQDKRVKGERGEISTEYEKTMNLINEVNASTGDPDLTFASLYYSYANEIYNDAKKIKNLFESIQERFKLKNNTTILLKDLLEEYYKLKHLEELPIEDSIDIIQRLQKNKTLSNLLMLMSIEQKDKIPPERWILINAIKKAITTPIPERIKQEIRKLQRKHNPERIRKLIMNFYLEKVKEYLNSDLEESDETSDSDIEKDNDIPEY